MIEAHSVAQVRAAEASYVAEGALMERAAFGLAAAVIDFLGGCYGRRILLLVGSGDNGGDALFAGAQLRARGARVDAMLLGSRVHPLGVQSFRAAGGRIVSGVPDATYDVAIDAIVGIGGRPGLRPEAVAALGDLRGVPVVSVDVPSGIGVDSGELEGPCVRADLTVAMGTYKIGLLVDPAAMYAGAVQLVPLDLPLPAAPVSALQPSDVAALLPWPRPASHKYSRGVVGVRAGSEAYPGAAVLAVGGALAGFAGLIRYVGTAAESVLSAHPEVVVGTGRVQCWVVGPGGGSTAEDALAVALADEVPCVIDADALLAVKPGQVGRSVLTPHAGELAAMIGGERESVEASPLWHVREAAASYQSVVLLKGRRTLIAHPDGRVRVTTTGVPWLATAGAGDVLAGMIGSLVAAGLKPFDAASVGSWLHGAAAALASGGGPLRASDLIAAIPAIVRSLRVPE